MLVTEKKISIKELVENYRDDNEGGVFGYNNRLTIRPAYQREFIYDDKKRDNVIKSIYKNFPIGAIYWSKTGLDSYEVLDGQQRIISISKYCHNDYAITIGGVPYFFINLPTDTQRAILNYKINIYICEGTEEEKLAWFQIINIAGEVLTEQELLNATYTGPWLASAKARFSKNGCVAYRSSTGYIKGNTIRQEYLSKVLKWAANRDGLNNGAAYMARHQHDENSNDIWTYFQEVMDWARRLFPSVKKGITDVQEWGVLYNKYKDRRYDPDTLEAEMQLLLADDDVTKQAGIIPYILSDQTRADEKHLSLRAFSDIQKHRKYEEQGCKCAMCHSPFAFEDMQGDHILPWSRGGKTIYSNLQMLCRHCNASKSDN